VFCLSVGEENFCATLNMVAGSTRRAWG
jgi:hypothetical protein